MKVLVTGAGGLLGGRLASLLARSHTVTGAYHLQPPPAGLAAVPLDLLDMASLERAFAQAAPDAVVHCAALADADLCEREPDRAERLNVDAQAALGRLCARGGVRLLSVSTDLVFAGDRAFSREDDLAQPLQAYGRSKLRGEEALLAADPSAAVVRVALVCGRGHGPRATASEAVAWSLAAGRSLRLFTDQYRTPVDADSTAAALAALLAGTQRGRFHLGGPARLSRYDLGLRVARALGLPEALVTPVTQREHAQGAPRPADVSLDSTRARRELGFAPRALDDAVRDGRPAAIIPGT